MTRSASTGSVSAPKFPCVSSPSVNLDSAVEVGLWIARCVSSTALSPVDIIDLPQSDIVGSVGVVTFSVSVSSGLMRDNAFAAGLIPTVFGAPGSDVLHVLGSSAIAFGTVSGWAIASARVREDQSGQKNQNADLQIHILEIYYYNFNRLNPINQSINQIILSMSGMEQPTKIKSSKYSYLHPILCGFFGFLATIIGSHFFAEHALSLQLLIGIGLFLLSNQLMLKFQFNSYNTNGATITTVIVFVVQVALVAIWSRKQIGAKWIFGVFCIGIGVLLLKTQQKQKIKSQ